MGWDSNNQPLVHISTLSLSHHTSCLWPSKWGSNGLTNTSFLLNHPCWGWSFLSKKKAIPYSTPWTSANSCLLPTHRNVELVQPQMRRNDSAALSCHGETPTFNLWTPQVGWCLPWIPLFWCLNPHPKTLVSAHEIHMLLKFSHVLVSSRCLFSTCTWWNAHQMLNSPVHASPFSPPMTPRHEHVMCHQSAGSSITFAVAPFHHFWSESSTEMMWGFNNAICTIPQSSPFLL